MSLQITCPNPHCRTPLSVHPAMAGKCIRCGKCNSPIQVPGAAAAAPAGAAPLPSWLGAPPGTPLPRPAATPSPWPPPYYSPTPTPLPRSAPTQSAQNAATVIAAPGALEALGPPPGGRIPLGPTAVIGRDPDRADVRLPHPHVSRLHAQITLQAGGTALISDLRSANGTFVNGQRIRTLAPLRPGDRIDIGPYSLTFTGRELDSQSRENNIELVGRQLCRHVADHQTGKPRALLDGIDLVIRPREFACIIGPSGSGKSTLLSALSARAPADSGRVLLNGKALYANFDALKQDMVVVPQTNVLHDSLSVEQALWYTARLRLPPDTSAAEARAEVDRLLEVVGLTPHRHTLIRLLSGGQQRRACLANELVSRSTLVFLDEVTSGLDEQTDQEMMELFRSLAQAGKTVVCITHTMANVERYCDLIVVLAPGGRLAFIGSPAETMQYFGVSRLGHVYEKLAEKSSEEWKLQFAASAHYHRYVASRLPPGVDGAAESVYHPPGRLLDRARVLRTQLLLLTRRYLAVMLGDKQTLAMMAVQSLLVATLLVMLFGNLREVDDKAKHARHSTTLLFLLAVSCFWFGCNNAAKELVKERPIYARERAFNLLISSYYASKLLLLVTLSWLQTVLLWGIVVLLCRPPGPPGEDLGVLLCLSLAGVSLGLAMSAVARTEDMAVTMIPLALIPQIVLADAIAPLKDASLLLGQAVVTAFWGVRALNGQLPKDVAQYAVEKQHEVGPAVGMILLHAGVLMLATVLLLYFKDGRDQHPGAALRRWLGRLQRLRGAGP